ncbi:probable mannan endo-1,4-beta-mannosidase 3 at C-terminar half [Coccomyxa sp. Obi]|nr:probable mannan endo-1,4-beta-mannosidase 3 at C-terminar half [Coccomyxa sp. Obi]
MTTHTKTEKNPHTTGTQRLPQQGTRPRHAGASNEPKIPQPVEVLSQRGQLLVKSENIKDYIRTWSARLSRPEGYSGSSHMNSAGRAMLLAFFLLTVILSNTFVAYAQEALGASQEQATAQHVALSANTTLQAKDVSHFDPAKYALPIPVKNSTTEAAKAARVESAVTTVKTLASKVPGFVSASGQNFILNGKAAYFAGTNAWYLPIRATYSDSQISQFFSVMAGQGVTLVRVFCFEDGYTLSNTPIQSSPGVYDENGLKRIDLIMATAAQYGIYVIVVPTNFEPVGGGISWYVDQLVGSGNDKELFYTDSRCKQAYKNYVSMLLNRINTYTGVQYKNDPTMFSFELMNEPHTRDLYEINRGLPPGKLVRDWIYEMSAFVKSIDSNHMVSTGEEGYRADGPTNAPHNNWNAPDICLHLINSAADIY